MLKKSLLTQLWNHSILIKKWDTENAFIDLVNGHKNVKWWYKNGESSSDYFSITTTNEDGNPANFLPDFIICMKDGSIGFV